MLTQVRSKSQITIPGAIVNRLGIREGDQLEVTEKDGVIQLVPVAVYPKGYVDQLEAELAQIKGKALSPKKNSVDHVSPSNNRIGAAKDLYQAPLTLEEFDRDNEEIAASLMGTEE